MSGRAPDASARRSGWGAGWLLGWLAGSAETAADPAPPPRRVSPSFPLTGGESYTIIMRNRSIDAAVPSGGVVSAIAARRTLEFIGTFFPQFESTTDWTATAHVWVDYAELSVTPDGRTIRANASSQSDARVLLSAFGRRGYECTCCSQVKFVCRAALAREDKDKDKDQQVHNGSG